MTILVLAASCSSAARRSPAPALAAPPAPCSQAGLEARIQAAAATLAAHRAAPGPRADAGPPATADGDADTDGIDAGPGDDELAIYGEAEASFAALRASCPAQDVARGLWLDDALAGAALRLGLPTLCRKLLTVGDDVDLAGHPQEAARMLETAARCEPGREQAGCDYKLDTDSVYCAIAEALAYAPRRRYALSDPPCRVPDHGDWLALPGDAGDLPGEACLGVRPPVRDVRDGDADVDDQLALAGEICPTLRIVTLAQGKPIERVLATAASWVSQPSDCCNLGGVHLARRGDHAYLVLQSDGPAHDCFGGTATTDYFSVERIRRGSLELVEGLAVGLH